MMSEPLVRYLLSKARRRKRDVYKRQIVLCSATQPAFERLKWPMRFAQPADMVIQNGQMREVFKRTEIKNLITPYGMSLDELADFAAEQIETKDSLLIVCNTKTTARQLYRKLDLQKETNCEVYHLSTSMCGKHREKVLEAIGKTPGFHEDRKVICVATQLCEAGIDFSFHCVIRIYAGIENIVQAAGRCNRSNEWGKPCEVFIVKLKGEKLGPLKVIKEAQDCCRPVSYTHLDVYKRQGQGCRVCFLQGMKRAGNCRKGYGWISNTAAVKMVLTKERLIVKGFYALSNVYQSMRVNY